MNTKTLIKELTLKAGPVKRIAYRRICVEWIVVTLICFVAIANLYGLRPDLSQQLSSPLFLGEMLINTMLIIVAGCAAIAFSYPDRAKAPLLKPALIVVFLGYSVITLITAFTEPALIHSHIEGVKHHEHGMACMLCIFSFAAIPALWMFYRLRQLASTKPMFAGAAALMMAVATGCLGVRLVEVEIMPTGLILWHYLPLLIISALGLVLGKKIFHW